MRTQHPKNLVNIRETDYQDDKMTYTIKKYTYHSNPP